jgi:hypothetical protein
MDRPIPSRAHDLRQSLGIIVIGLVDLHLERLRIPTKSAGYPEVASAIYSNLMPATITR